MDTLAVIENDPETLASVIERAALHATGDDAGQEMFVRVTETCIETPASATGATQSSYCTIDAERFDRLDVTVSTAVDAMFEIDAFLGWLDWFDSDSVTVRFCGERGVVTELVLAAGDDEVVVDCPEDPAVLENVQTDLPERFAGAQFLGEDGSPMPTTVETTAAQLGRLVAAVDLANAEEGYPLVVRDGGLVVDVIGEESSATAPLDATTDGPAVTNHYGPDFAAVVRGLEGEVRLQTGPGEPVAFVQQGPDYTLRFVVANA
jgi:hypothetical protein